MCFYEFLHLIWKACDFVLRATFKSLSCMLNSSDNVGWLPAVNSEEISTFLLWLISLPHIQNLSLFLLVSTFI